MKTLTVTLFCLLFCSVRAAILTAPELRNNSSIYDENNLNEITVTPIFGVSTSETTASRTSTPSVSNVENSTSAESTHPNDQSSTTTAYKAKIPHVTAFGAWIITFNFVMGVISVIMVNGFLIYEFLVFRKSNFKTKDVISLCDK